MGGTKTGMNQFRGRNRLEDGLAPTSTKDKQDVPVLIRLIIGHAHAPLWCFLHTGVVWRPHGSAAHAVHRLGHPEHCALDLRPVAKDLAR